MAQQAVGPFSLLASDARQFVASSPRLNAVVSRRRNDSFDRATKVTCQQFVTFEALCSGRMHGPFARRTQAAEGQLIEEDQTNWMHNIKRPLYSQTDPERSRASIAILLYLIPDSRMTRPYSIYCLRK
jgi:hypothetical protein